MNDKQVVKCLVDQGFLIRLQQELTDNAITNVELLSELQEVIGNPTKMVGKILTEEEMHGWDKRAGNVVWVDKPKSGFLFCQS